jgi:hypothetical protein
MLAPEKTCLLWQIDNKLEDGRFHDLGKTTGLVANATPQLTAHKDMLCGAVKPRQALLGLLPIRQSKNLKFRINAHVCTTNAY